MFNRIFETIRVDVQAAKERDPAARTSLEIFLAYPGLHAVWAHHLAHWLWGHNLKLAGRVVSHISRFFTGIEIHPGAKLCANLFIDHGMGVVIGETAEVGCNVTLYHGVTLGGVSLEKGKRHPTIEENVVIGAGAKVLGAITVGRGSRIGANAVVVKDVPPDSVVVGVPGQVVRRSKPIIPAFDLNHGQLPDTLGESLRAVMERLDELEESLKGHDHPEESADTVSQVEPGQNGNNGHYSPDRQEHHGPHTPQKGVWDGEDFMI